MQDPNLKHDLRYQGNLSNEQLKHLVAVAGDPKSSEEQWSRACEILGDYNPVAAKKQRRFVAPVVLGFLAVFTAGAFWMCSSHIPTYGPTPSPSVYAPESVSEAPAPHLTAPPDTSVWGPYMADLQRRIKRAWFPPKNNESKRVLVRFHIDVDGQMSKLALHQSSGAAVVDQAALKAVENAAPFRHLPTGITEGVDIEFTFDYNVFTGQGSGGFNHL